MGYRRLVWQNGPGGNTPTNAANLNRMEEGIDPATRFTISGMIGGNSPIEVPGVNEYSAQRILVSVPDGKSLKVMRVRWYVSPLNFMLRVRSLNMFETTQPGGGEEEAEFTIFHNTTGQTMDVIVEVALFGSGPIDPRSSWWIDMAIEDE